MPLPPQVIFSTGQEEDLTMRGWAVLNIVTFALLIKYARRNAPSPVHLISDGVRKFIRVRTRRPVSGIRADP